MDIDLDALEVRRVFDYDRSLLPNKFLAQVDSQSTDIRSAIDTSGLSMGYPAWNLIYYICYCALPWDVPEVNVVETGTNIGFSSIVLAQVLHDRKLKCKLHTVDIAPLSTLRAKQNVAEAGLLDYVRFYTGDSTLFLQDYVQQVETVHFAFLDGSHEAGHVVREFEILHPTLKEGQSTVYFDNTSDEGVAEALLIIKDRFGGNLVQFPSCSWAPPGNAIWQP
jgi:cephalosporin hydroxylase